jgi:hypothetical protein
VFDIFVISDVPKIDDISAMPEKQDNELELGLPERLLI